MANALSVAVQARNTNLQVQNPRVFWGSLAWDNISITFLISLFNQKVRLYETNNNGRWYDFGFCLGAGIIFGNGAHQGIRIS